MATIAQAQSVDRSKLVKAGSGFPQAPQPMVALPAEPQSPSPFMMCSLPPRAASFDQYVRQFYGRSNVPQQRILIPNL